MAGLFTWYYCFKSNKSSQKISTLHSLESNKNLGKYSHCSLDHRSIRVDNIQINWCRILFYYIITFESRCFHHVLPFVSTFEYLSLVFMVFFSSPSNLTNFNQKFWIYKTFQTIAQDYCYSTMMCIFFTISVFIEVNRSSLFLKKKYFCSIQSFFLWFFLPWVGFCFGNIFMLDSNKRDNDVSILSITQLN